MSTAAGALGRSRGRPAVPPPALTARATLVPAGRRSFWRSPGSMLGLLLIAIAAGGALAAPWLGPYDPTVQDLERRLDPPGAHHVLGTDALGRDVLSRLLWGARASLGTAGVVMALVLVVAVAVGTVSGYHGGWIDQVLMRLVDVLMAFPGIILAIAVAGMLGPGLGNVIVAMAAVSWVDYARVIRGMTLSLREREFVVAARAIGARDRRIMARHVVPNLAGPVVVLATLDMGRVMLGVSALSFLGLGAQPPAPEWGAMLNDGLPYLQIAPLLTIYPGLAIALTALGFNLLGDGLRDLLDPHAPSSPEERRGHETKE